MAHRLRTVALAGRWSAAAAVIVARRPRGTQSRSVAMPCSLVSARLDPKGFECSLMQLPRVAGYLRRAV